MPQNQPQSPKTPFDVSQPSPLPEIVANSAAPLVHDFTPNTGGVPRTHALFGLIFLIISIIGGMGLILAMLPVPAKEAPKAQTAAAAEAHVDVFSGVQTAARGVYVFDAQNDKQLYAKNSSMQLPLASITKVATVLAVAEVLAPTSTVTISRGAVARGGGGLTWGEEWRVSDLIEYTLITSSNTGAEALAETAEPFLAAKYPDATRSNATIWRMNALAQELGMHETYFINPTGLDESATQAGAQSSARDVATLFAYALRSHKELFTGTAETNIPLGPINFPERYARNTNNALADIPGLIMGKTGTTDLAGGNLAIAFNAAADHPVIVVVLGSTPEARFNDVKKLVAAAQKSALSD